MNIAVKQERSIWYLQKVYQWKYPRLGSNSPEQELLGVKAQYHSRFDQDHYRNCKSCWEEHLDFEEQCRIDEQDDFADEVEDY